ncbi:MAG: hypothetical protein ABS882_03545 [Lysinibacillus sp.]
MESINVDLELQINELNEKYAFLNFEMDGVKYKTQGIVALEENSRTDFYIVYYATKEDGSYYYAIPYIMHIDGFINMQYPVEGGEHNANIQLNRR